MVTKLKTIQNSSFKPYLQLYEDLSTYNHNKHTGNTIIPHTGKIQATQNLKIQ